MARPAPTLKQPRRVVRRAPARTQPLSRDRIVQAALALVEDESLAGLSTRRLGERLGCEAMSIYHHFPSKQHLLDALVEHALGEVDVPAPGPDAVDRIRAVLESYRAMARRRPALYPLVAVHRLNMAAGVRFIESVLRLFHALLGSDERAARHFRAIGYLLTGACLDETAGYARGPSAAEPVDAASIARECPRLAAAAVYFAPAHWDATWQLGVDAAIARMLQDVPAVAPRGRRRRDGAA